MLRILDRHRVTLSLDPIVRQASHRHRAITRSYPQRSLARLEAYLLEHEIPDREITLPEHAA
ncbi:MAG: hypothetical protein WD294_10095 [Phycisphaeraceae bacterium]